MRRSRNRTPLLLRPPLVIVGLALAALLGGCTIIISDTLPSFVSDLVVDSNYRDANGRKLICDEATTVVSYTFFHDEALSHWHARLQGTTTGRVSGSVTLTPERLIGTEKHTYVIEPFAAPLAVTGETASPSADPRSGPEIQSFQGEPSAASLHSADGSAVDLAPDGIVVVPIPTVIGYTDLRLTFVSVGGGSVSVLAARLPVVSGCF